MRVFLYEQAVARRLNAVAACGLALALAGCSPTMQPRAELTPQPVQPTTTAAPTGDTIGTGPVRIALIAPITQGAGQSVVGASLRNAVDLAVQQIPELQEVAGVEVLGTLPGDLHMVTTFVAGIGASSAEVERAQALIDLLRSRPTAELFRAKGLDPA